MKRLTTRLAALGALALAVLLAACAGGRSSSTTTPTELSWEGEAHSGTYTTTFEGLGAGDPITVDYTITAGTATIELSQDGVTPYAWNEASGEHSEVVFVNTGGDWEAKVTLTNATGSVELETKLTDAAAEQADADDDADNPEAPADQAQVANPFQTVTSLDSLSDVAGFAVSFPAELPGYGTPSLLQAIPGSLAEARYGTDHDAVVRKGTGTGAEVSGDYENHPYTTTADVGGHQVTLSGEQADEIELATWDADGYGYSLSVDDDISEQGMAALVALIG